MQRYFASTFAKELTLDEITSQHISKVMRNNIGDIVYICINKVYYKYKITNIAKNVSVTFVEKLDINNENNLYTTLLIPILKKDNHKIAIQKAIELGANEIILYQGDNSVVKWNQPQSKIEKLKTFVMDACRQSFRNEICKISFSNLTNLDFSSYDQLLFGDETKHTVSTLKLHPNNKVLFISGCEGGFSQREYDFFTKNNIKPLSLAKTILRAETAPIAFCAIISSL